LTLVDENDNEIGRETRKKCHLGKGKMHRAIAVFLFTDKNLMLIQQRSQKEQLWPGYWDCTVATHVYPNETYEEAAERALRDELDVSASVKKILAFTYFAPFGRHAENEYCALLVGSFNGTVTPNINKVSNIAYINIEELSAEMNKKPKAYTPWLKIALEKFLKHPLSETYRA